VSVWTLSLLVVAGALLAAMVSAMAYAARARA
jgi:hypothetical protein